MGISLRMRLRRAAYAVRTWLRSILLEWPTAMRVQTHDGVRHVHRVTRHEIHGGHLLIEDADGCLYLWAMSDVRSYGPMRRVELPAAMLQQPAQVVF